MSRVTKPISNPPMSQRTTIIVVLLVSIVRAQDLRKNCADIEGDETNVPFDCAANVPLGLDWTLKDSAASITCGDECTYRTCCDQPVCGSEDGSSENTRSGECFCGTSLCTTQGGLYCIKAKNLCRANSVQKQCTNIDGTAINQIVGTSDGCICGVSPNRISPKIVAYHRDICTKDTGLFCHASPSDGGLPYCRKDGYTFLNQKPDEQGTVRFNWYFCNRFPGSGYITTLEQCTEALSASNANVLYPGKQLQSIPWKKNDNGRFSGCWYQSNKFTFSEQSSAANIQELWGYRWRGANYPGSGGGTVSMPLCWSGPPCTNTNGTKLNMNACLCGKILCKSSSSSTINGGGMYCDAANNLCTDKPLCEFTDGMTENKKRCNCYGEECDYSRTGLFCLTGFVQSETYPRTRGTGGVCSKT